MQVNNLEVKLSQKKSISEEAIGIKRISRVNSSGGSRISRRGGVDCRGGYVSEILYVKMKESGPVGGARAGRAPPLGPPMNSFQFIVILQMIT